MPVSGIANVYTFLVCAKSYVNYTLHACIAEQCIHVNYTLHACIAEQCIHVNYILDALWNNASFNIEAMYVGASWFSALRLGIRELYYVECNFVSSHSICCCCWERPEGMMVLCQYSSNRQSLMWF